MQQRHSRRILRDGSVAFFNDANQLHRDDGPAVITPEGGLRWYQNGKQQRSDGPSHIDPNCGAYFDNNMFVSILGQSLGQKI